MTEKTAKEITLHEHVSAIVAQIPDYTSINFEVRVSWNKKLQDYVVSQDYYSTPSTLLRFTIRKPKGITS